MTERKVLRIFCSKAKGAHEVGAVWLEDERLLLRFTHAARDVDGFAPVMMTSHPDDNEDGIFAWCTACRMRLVCSTGQIMSAARKGQSHITLIPEGFIKDPLGVLTRRDRRRLR